MEPDFIEVNIRLAQMAQAYLVVKCLGAQNVLLFRVIGDERLRRLIDVILAGSEGVLADEYDMVYFPGDDLVARLRPRGLPIGNLTSQFWSNCYLNPLDCLIARELGCRAYLRYLNDLALFSVSKRELEA